ncbi:alpha-1,3-rhamnosyltransferase [Marinobacter sp. MBR-99]|uniref:glycosyltransferase family 2 protein n=1 Tax=Marinobacter sp. MBR-99 TaxID=3156461 RepID=UPI0033925908
MSNAYEISDYPATERCQDNPLVSVIVPCYNHEKYVKECIESIIDQDYKNLELIIIDDGSQDRSSEVIKAMAAACEARFVRFSFRSRENRGLCATLNEAVEWAEGEFLSPLASDDVLFPEKVSRQISEFKKRALEKSNLVAIYSGVEFIDSESQPLKIKKGGGKFCGFDGVILRNVFLPTPTFLVKREAIISVGGFNPDYKIEDFYIRLKLTDNGGVFFVMPEPLVKYRRHDDNFSQKSDQIWRGVLEILSDYSDRIIYKKALAMSIMVQAHDFQTVSTGKGLRYVCKAIGIRPSVFFSRSMFRFFVKIFFRL